MTHPVIFKVKAGGDMVIISHHQGDFKTTAGMNVTAAARGGHVWPKSWMKRIAFIALRRVFGNRGRVAAWTRTWRGPWVVIRGDTGRKLPGEFETHGDAVKAEITWLLRTL